MASLVEVAVVVPWFLAPLPRRDHRGLAGGLQGLDHALIGIEAFIAEYGVGLGLRQEVIGALEVMRLAAGQQKAGGIAQRIDGGVDFGAQSAARAPDRLVLAGFFLAPALCWWARTMVLSIIAYSLSASAARS